MTALGAGGVAAGVREPTCSVPGGARKVPGWWPVVVSVPQGLPCEDVRVGSGRFTARGEAPALVQLPTEVVRGIGLVGG